MLDEVTPIIKRMERMIALEKEALPKDWGHGQCTIVTRKKLHSFEPYCIEHNEFVTVPMRGLE